jgi:hypothetical protein
MRIAFLLGALALTLAWGVASADAKCTGRFCGSYHGSTQTATDPVGNVSTGGPLGFVVNAKGVVAVTASGTWNCSRNGNDIASEAFNFDKTFKGRPGHISRKGKFAFDRYFGDLHMSFEGRIKKGKFSGLFSLGFLGGGDGCGTATMPAMASK